MKGALGRAKAEQIKWWDALDLIADGRVRRDVAKGLRLARDCKENEDALWLSSLFPQDDVTEDEMLGVLLAQGDDPRALFLSARLVCYMDRVLMLRRG